MRGREGSAGVRHRVRGSARDRACLSVCDPVSQGACLCVCVCVSECECESVRVHVCKAGAGEARGRAGTRVCSCQSTRV